MKNSKKILSLSMAATMLAGSTTAFAMPADVIVLGDKAFEILALSEDNAELQAEINAALAATDAEGMFYRLGSTGDFINLSEDDVVMTAAQQTALKNVVLTKADGTKETYANFEDESGTVVEQADLTAYNTALNAVKEADYTAESWVIYQAVVTANPATTSNTQAEVDAAKDKIIEAQKALVSVNGLAVESVSAINASQLKVMFNKALTEEEQVEAKKAVNVEVYDNGSTTANITLNEGVMDGDSAVVFTVANVGTLTNNISNLKVIVEGEAKGLTSTDDQTFENIAVLDTVRPTIESVEQVGKDTIKVTFTEPVKDNDNILDTSAFKVDGGAIGVDTLDTNTTATNEYKSVVLNLSADISVGTHTIEVNPSTVSATNTVKDAAGWELTQAAYTFVIATDVVAPVVTVKSASPTQVVLEFDETVSNANISSTYYYHTAKADAYKIAGNVGTYDSEKKTMTLDYSAVPLPSGNVTIFVDYADATADTAKIKDAYDNFVAPQTIAATVIADDVKPEVTSATKASSTTINVKFSEPVNEVVGGINSAINKNNYSLKLNSETVAISSVTKHGSLANTYIVTVGSAFGGGDYALAISNVKDKASTPTTMDAYSKVITIADSIAPLIAEADGTTDTPKAYLLSTDKKKVKLYFSEAMNTADVATLTKYQNVADTYANPTVAEVATNGKSVVLTFANAVTGDVVVGQLVDANGVKMAALSQTLNTENATAPGLLVKTDFDSVQVIDKNTIKVYLETVITNLTKDDFAVEKAANDDKEVPASISYLVENGATVVTITTVTELGTGDFVNAPAIQTVANSSVDADTQHAATGAEDAYGNKLNIALTDAVDKAMPTLVTDKYETLDADGDSKIDHIVLTFSEKMNKINLDKNDFTVEGHTIIAVTTDTDGALTKDGTNTVDPDNAFGDGASTETVVITINEGTVADTAATPKVTIAANKAEDLKGNKFAGLVATAAKDKAKPVLTAAEASKTVVTMDALLSTSGGSAVTTASTLNSLFEGATNASLENGKAVTIAGKINGTAITAVDFTPTDVTTQTVADCMAAIAGTFGLESSAVTLSAGGEITITAPAGTYLTDVTLTAETGSTNKAGIDAVAVATTTGFVTVTFSEAISLDATNADTDNMGTYFTAASGGTIDTTTTATDTAMDATSVTTYDVYYSTAPTVAEVDGSNATIAAKAVAGELVDSESNVAAATAVDIAFE